jgi:hypothetical protein
MLARFGIDTRDTTGDRRLIDLCMHLPREIYLDPGRVRRPYHRAFAGRFPFDCLISTFPLTEISWAIGGPEGSLCIKAVMLP